MSDEEIYNLFYAQLSNSQLLVLVNCQFVFSLYFTDLQNPVQKRPKAIRVVTGTITKIFWTMKMETIKGMQG